MRKKYRHELKFVISSDVAIMLKQRLSLIMETDKNAKSPDHRYFIRSLYFDDIDSTSYDEKLDGILFRKKYRFRFYNMDPSYVILECKHKHDNLTYKDQMVVSKQLVEQLLAGQEIDVNYQNQNLLNEFLIERKIRRLIPSIVVDYYRLAFVYQPLNVRITFDEYIKSGYYNTNLFEEHYLGIPVLKQNEVVLEIKFNEIIPTHILHVIRTVPTMRQAISKFAICRSTK